MPTTISSIIIIPARMGGKRLPGKSLMVVGDKPLIQWTYDKAIQCKEANEVLVTSSDTEIIRYCNEHVIPSRYSGDCKNGTQRCYKAITSYNPYPSIVVNWQVDEPDVNPEDVDRMIQGLKGTPGQLAIRTLVCEDCAYPSNPHLTKCLMDETFRCHWFCREWIRGVFAHIGVYGFSIQSLLAIANLPQTRHSKIQDLEQLTWIEHGHKIYATMIDKLPISINTKQDFDFWSDSIETASN